MNRIWIKLYLEILDDPKMGRLSDHLWRRVVEFFLLAGKKGEDGELPTVDEISWILHASHDDVEQDLTALEKVGIVSRQETGWFVTAFKKRQYSESYERVKRYRERYSNVTNDEEVALQVSSSSSPLNSLSEGGGMGEGAVTVTVPETPRQAAEHPDIQLYAKITNGFPGDKNYRVIVETIQHLREKHGSNLTDYLMRFWTAWSTRKTKDGKPYSASSLVWLCEWAMQGSVPSANGHEPKPTQNWTPIPDVEATKKMLEEREKKFKKMPTGKSIAELAGRMSK